MESNLSELIEAAMNVRQLAYAPYSKLAVGAALLTSDGKIFTGCNVENASYGLAICAERNAICAAVAQGFRDYQRIVVAAAPLATPCGACRQFIYEFGKQVEVICVNANDLSVQKSWTIFELLPNGFEI